MCQSLQAGCGISTGWQRSSPSSPQSPFMRPTGPGQPAHLLLDVLELVNGFGIPYAVVGAFAVSYYGVPRFTNDADSVIWLRDGGESANDLKEPPCRFRICLRSWRFQGGFQLFHDV